MKVACSEAADLLQRSHVKAHNGKADAYVRDSPVGVSSRGA